MSQALIKTHPEILKYTSVKVCELDLPAQGAVRFVNHNNVMVKDKLKIVNPDGTEAADGLKTGYINAGGSSVVLTGKRGGKRAIVVVLGSNSAAERDGVARAKLEDALGALSF
jgi:D-alanyl-D-alanine carboxypeptidase